MRMENNTDNVLDFSAVQVILMLTVDKQTKGEEAYGK